MEDRHAVRGQPCREAGILERGQRLDPADLAVDGRGHADRGAGEVVMAGLRLQRVAVAGGCRHHARGGPEPPGGRSLPPRRRARSGRRSHGRRQPRGPAGAPANPAPDRSRRRCWRSARPGGRRPGAAPQARSMPARRAAPAPAPGPSTFSPAARALPADRLRHGRRPVPAGIEHDDRLECRSRRPSGGPASADSRRSAPPRPGPGRRRRRLVSMAPPRRSAPARARSASIAAVVENPGDCGRPARTRRRRHRRARARTGHASYPSPQAAYLSVRLPIVDQKPGTSAHAALCPPRFARRPPPVRERRPSARRAAAAPPPRCGPGRHRPPPARPASAVRSALSTGMAPPPSCTSAPRRRARRAGATPVAMTTTGAAHGRVARPARR